MAKFNSVSKGTKTVNYAGGAAYSQDAETELATLALTSFVSGQFYRKESDILSKIVDLSAKVSKEFLANLTVFARKEYGMRSISHVLCGELIKNHKGMKKAVLAVIQRPDDMNEIVAYYGFRYGKPLPNSLKKAVREKLGTLSTYEFGKYGCKNKDVKLVDLFNLTHPKPKNEEQAEVFNKVLNGKLESPETWEVLISTAKDDSERKRAWERLIMEDKLGYMALLRNLRNLEKYNVSDEAMAKACSVITDPERVKTSKQLPFRFLSAYREATSTRTKDAISIALDHSVSNIPKLDGRTAIVVDVSGSMNSHISDKSSISYADIARLFGVALFKANNDSRVYAFDDTVSPCFLSSRTPVIDLVQGIPVRGGATDLYKVFNFFADNNLEYDRVIVLSDMQAWNSGYGSSSVNPCFEAWKKKCSVNPFVYSIDLAGYGTSPFGQVNLLAGWSEKVFDLFGVLEQDKKALVNTIKSYEIYQ